MSRTLLARAFLLLGVLLLAAAGMDALRAEAWQHEYRRQLAAAAASAAAGRHASPAPAIGEPIGWLEIPRIGLAGAVVHGDADAILNVAIGHLPDTPFPWDAGNAALAAHRDTFFRPLQHVRPDDLLRLRTPHGGFEYRVRSTSVVDPDDLSVLEPTPTAALTLITCYPFHYVGTAPRRFIVRAERIQTMLGGMS